jgi:hypothetical protein
MHSKAPQWGHSQNKGPRMTRWYMIPTPHLRDVLTHGQHEEKVIMHLNIYNSWGKGLFILQVNPSKLKDIIYLYEHKISPFLKECMFSHQELGITPFLFSRKVICWHVQDFFKFVLSLNVNKFAQMVEKRSCIGLV